MNIHALRANRRANEAVDMPVSGEAAAMIAAASQECAVLDRRL